MKTKSRAPRFSAIYHWEMDVPAYRLLSAGGRALLIEFRRKYTGSNNGNISMSVREAARLLGCHKDTAAKALLDLEEKGWVCPMQKGSFRWSCETGTRRVRPATTWRITNQPIGLGTDTPATKDFMQWVPPGEN